MKNTNLAPTTKLAFAFKLGNDAAHLLYLKDPKSATNPFTRKSLIAEWRRGWLQGCDEVLNELRAKGECIDV